jgi:hypothetical protein
MRTHRTQIISADAGLHGLSSGMRSIFRNVIIPYYPGSSLEKAIRVKPKEECNLRLHSSASAASLHSMSFSPKR